MREVNLIQPLTASSETAREINRRILLNLIRNRQPISRADLARISGLQRSTVSLIIEELIDAGWVIEGPAGISPRGRRPIILHLNEKRAVICVDIRPSQITMAIGHVNGEIRSQRVFRTDPDPTVALKEIAKFAKELIRQNPKTAFEGIGISLPGRSDPQTQELIFAPNLGWPRVDLKAPLERATGLPVELENAANGCALAQLWFNGEEDLRDLVAVTVSEGIGTGIIAHGRLITGHSGMAGEFGHVPLDPQGPQCSCGNRGCWELLASNRAALRYYYESAAKPRGRFEFADLLSLADGGDAAANAALSRMAGNLAWGTRFIVAALAPQAIIFIGEFTAAWSKFLPALQAAVDEQSVAIVPPKLQAGESGATARIRGAIALVFQKHFSAPA